MSDKTEHIAKTIIYKAKEGFYNNPILKDAFDANLNLGLEGYQRVDRFLEDSQIVFMRNLLSSFSLSFIEFFAENYPQELADYLYDNPNGFNEWYFGSKYEDNDICIHDFFTKEEFKEKLKLFVFLEKGGNAKSLSKHYFQQEFLKINESISQEDKRLYKIYNHVCSYYEVSHNGRTRSIKSSFRNFDYVDNIVRREIHVIKYFENAKHVFKSGEYRKMKKWGWAYRLDEEASYPIKGKENPEFTQSAFLEILRPAGFCGHFNTQAEEECPFYIVRNLSDLRTYVVAEKHLRKTR